MNVATQEPIQKTRTFNQPRGGNESKIDGNRKMRQVVRFPFFYAEISKKRKNLVFRYRTKIGNQTTVFELLGETPVMPNEHFNRCDAMIEKVAYVNSAKTFRVVLVRERKKLFSYEEYENGMGVHCLLEPTDRNINGQLVGKFFVVSSLQEISDRSGKLGHYSVLLREAKVREIPS